MSDHFSSLHLPSIPISASKLKVVPHRSRATPNPEPNAAIIVIVSTTSGQRRWWCPISSSSIWKGKNSTTTGT